MGRMGRMGRIDRIGGKGVMGRLAHRSAEREGGKGGTLDARLKPSRSIGLLATPSRLERDGFSRAFSL
jgi:hypothetical protein